MSIQNFALHENNIGSHLVFYMPNIIYEKALSFISHWWFCTTCISFVVISSIPRIFVTIDAFVSVCLYIASIDNGPNSKITFESTSALITNDLKNYNFKTSLTDLIIVIFLRTAILFKCFAYKNQNTYNRSPSMIAFCVCLTSSFFVITKLIFLENTKNRHLLLFALIFNWICLIFYFIFRRKDTIQFKRLYEASDSLELAEFSESVNSIPLLSKNDLNELLNKPKNKISHEKDRFLVAQKTNFEQFLKINGRIFCYKLIKSRFVNKKLTNLVFICGFLDFHNNWDHIAKKLSFNNKTKKIVILNLVAETKLGQNKNLINDQKLGKNYFQLSNKIINKLFDVLNIKTAIIVSRSIFAKNALSFAMSNRERVKGLLMLSPCDRLPSFLVSAIKSKIGEKETKKLVKSEIINFQNTNPLFTDVKTSSLKNIFEQNKIDSWFEKLKEIVFENDKYEHFFENEKVKNLTKSVKSVVIWERRSDIIKFKLKEVKTVLLENDISGDLRKSVVLENFEFLLNL